ncbi:MAG: hypothetical protein M5R36_06465 [Deltaproteobacteria bacterium]|nr:hypothetical protein [Deltaproteobacteria bacterium]
MRLRVADRVDLFALLLSFIWTHPANAERVGRRITIGAEVFVH